MPTVLKPYWAYRDELSLEDGIILKGSEQVLVPKSVQQYVLQTIHGGHQGRDKCRLRAKGSVYWNGINNQIEEMVAECPACQEYACSQRKEPLMPKVVPPRPWHTLAADFFQLDGSGYLLIADAYPKFPLVKDMGKTTTARATIRIMKEYFAMFGVPEVLYTDNGPQFVSYEFQNFAREWGFIHKTSSPRYAQSNGFIERMVQTIKITMKKARRQSDDIDLALLCFRSIPIDDKLKSPCELLMNWKVKANLPVCMRNQLEDLEHIEQQLSARQQKQREAFNSSAGPQLLQLWPGQRVRVQETPTGTWIPAVVTRKDYEPRSYWVRTPNGSEVRRNRVHIGECPSPPTRAPLAHCMMAGSPIIPTTADGMKNANLDETRMSLPSHHRPNVDTPSCYIRRQCVDTAKDHALWSPSERT